MKEARVTKEPKGTQLCERVEVKETNKTPIKKMEGHTTPNGGRTEPKIMVFD